MSRVGHRPVELPEGVDVTVKNGYITVTGSEGELTRELSKRVTVEVSDEDVRIAREDDSREARSHHGLMRSLVVGMVRGVDQGFERKLEINGVGYRARKIGESFLRFDLGYSHPIMFELPDVIDAKVEDQKSVTLRSPDKELLGQISAKVRGLRPPEPYKGKGIRWSDEVIRRKVGKAGAA